MWMVTGAETEDDAYRVCLDAEEVFVGFYSISESESNSTHLRRQINEREATLTAINDMHEVCKSELRFNSTSISLHTPLIHQTVEIGLVIDTERFSTIHKLYWLVH